MKVIQNYALILNFMKNKIIDIFKTCWFTKPFKLWWQKNSKKILHVLEDNASGVQVGDIKQAMV